MTWAYSGSSLDLLEMPGTDPAGYAGFGAKVDNRLNKAFASAPAVGISAPGRNLANRSTPLTALQRPAWGRRLPAQLARKSQTPASSSRNATSPLRRHSKYRRAIDSMC